MAQSYKYALEMAVPLGKRTGTLKLHIQGRDVTGNLTLFMRTTDIRAGTYDNGTVDFQGTMQTLTKTMPYTAHGTLTRRTIVLDFDTERGSYHAVGLSDRTAGAK